MAVKTDEDRISKMHRENRAMARLSDVIEQVRGHIGPTAPVRRARVFFAVARKPGISRYEIADEVDAGDTTVWHDLLALGDTDRHGRPGLQLIQGRCEAPGGTTLVYRTTRKGQAVADSLAGLVRTEADTG